MGLVGIIARYWMFWMMVMFLDIICSLFNISWHRNLHINTNFCRYYRTPADLELIFGNYSPRRLICRPEESTPHAFLYIFDRRHNFSIAHREPLPWLKWYYTQLYCQYLIDLEIYHNINPLIKAQNTKLMKYNLTNQFK